MKDLFIQNPTQDAVVMADKMFGYHDGMLDIGEEEVRQVVSHASNILLIETSSSSANRVGDALEEVLLKAKRIATGYDLFSATRTIVRISYSPQNPLMMGEMESLVEFAENFHSECKFIWGVREDDNLVGADISVLMVAANLKQLVMSKYHKHVDRYGDKPAWQNK